MEKYDGLGLSLAIFKLAGFRPGLPELHLLFISRLMALGTTAARSWLLHGLVLPTSGSPEYISGHMKDDVLSQTWYITLYKLACHSHSLW
jgi:hypothetical protein